MLFLWTVPKISPQVIKRFILHAKKTGFVVEHDFIMATYLADRVSFVINDSLQNFDLQS